MAAASRQRLGRAWQLLSTVASRQRLERLRRRRASVEVDLGGSEIFPPEAGAVSNEIDALANFAGNLDIDDSAGDLHAPDTTRDLGSKTCIADLLQIGEFLELSKGPASP